MKTQNLLVWLALVSTDEAILMAPVGGALGGGAMRTDFATAQRKLIDQRTELLNEYLKQAAAN